jgi:serine/threonine protein kinase
LVPQILLGLEHFRKLGYSYRDVKPENMLLDEAGHVKISDLGLTVKLHPDIPLRHCAGTAGYWSPEVWRQGIVWMA